jgi:hypothetical protein
MFAFGLISSVTLNLLKNRTISPEELLGSMEGEAIVQRPITREYREMRGNGGYSDVI